MKIVQAPAPAAQPDRVSDSEKSRGCDARHVLTVSAFDACLTQAREGWIVKIYIMTDMEGVCGVLDHDNWVRVDSRYYEKGKKLLTLEVNAAIEGFFSEGATEILVADGHGCGGVNNLLLDRRALYQRDFPGPYPFGLDKTFAVMAWIGQHAKAGTPYAHIAHTGWFDVLDCTI
ncbi:MAG: M55 family metallopeptidase, partial [Clostridiaceae bacterium]|nr:M55 family metallopeptidase [Clostridiaceae bacterium]